MATTDGIRVASPQIDVQVASEAAGIPDADEICAWAALALERQNQVVEVTVRVVDEAEMQVLNRDYRDADKPTNVLSFPAGDLSGLPADVARPLGDIVICAGVVAAEARDQNKAPADHWAHMLVHGVLHLLGHDHETDAEAAEMEALERRCLAAAGIDDPYRAR